jgi:predicted RNA-binding Zn-ribbon protein involved in translation (DUF1610 family)
VAKAAKKAKPADCPGCGAPLNQVDYKMWGSKKFNFRIGLYDEDETLGKSDIEFSCPKCSAELDPEGLIF